MNDEKSEFQKLSSLDVLGSKDVTQSEEYNLKLSRIVLSVRKKGTTKMYYYEKRIIYLYLSSKT